MKPNMKSPPRSASTNLPDGCEELARGLVLKEDLGYDAWMAVGKRQSVEAGASSWRLGDWFAFGISHYQKTKWGDKVPDGLYAEVAAQIGTSEGALRNATWVCRALPLSRRRDKLTFGHAQEIVGRADPEDHDQWIATVVESGISIKALREMLRKSKATYAPEAGDTAEDSFLETNRQFSRDYNAGCPSPLTPAYRDELRKIHARLLEDLG